MSNKFQQSVLQQLENVEKNKPTPKMQTKTVSKKEPKLTTPTPQNKKESEAKNASDIPDMTDFLRIEPQRVSKNKTFYLDEEVIDALTVAAKRQKVSDSKLCNDILRRVLGIKTGQ